MQTQWKQRPFPEGCSDETINEIVEDCGISPLTANILVKRGCVDAEAAMAYLEPEWDDLYNPYELPDMEGAIQRLIALKSDGGKVCVYGDYDADGTTAVAILLKYFATIGIDAVHRIPNRLVEGYGMNIPALEEVVTQGATVVLTVDNGIAAKDEVEYLNSKGVDVIVTDHHECQGSLPEALAVVDPKRPDSVYPFAELCGAGIAFKLIQALDMKLDMGSDLSEYVECAALATVADIVPLKDENRIIVSMGIRSMNAGPLNAGISALVEVSEIERVTAGNIGFVLAPKINAAGRLGEADRVLDLYLGKDNTAVMAAAVFLRDENARRQQIEQEILEAAIKTVTDEKKYESDFLIVAGEEWHSGVIGIVASKLQERWYRPTIVMGIDETGVARGSCRSVSGVDIFAALSSCSDLFLSYGGHEQAAGFSITRENIPKLEEALAKWGTENQVKNHLVQTLYYDGDLMADEVDFDLMDELEQCEPYGVGNPGPVFQLPVEHASNVRTMGKDQSHLSFTSDGLRCVAFGMGEAADTIRRGDCAVLCKLKRHSYGGTDSIQPMVTDIKGNELFDNKQCWQWLTTVLNEDDSIIQTLPLWRYPEAQIMPSRVSMVAVYKMIHPENGLTIAFDELLSIREEMNSFQLLVVFNALQQADLIQFKLRRGILSAKQCKVIEKKDIQKTALVIKLKQYLKIAKRED